MKLTKKEKDKNICKKKKNKKLSLSKKQSTNKEKDLEILSLKEQIISMVYFEIIGAILCLLILFALCGGKNYFKLYKELQKLINVYDTITENYYGELDKEKLIDSAIDSMINSIGDDYTIYKNSEEKDSLLTELEGTYEGIGCSVTTTMNGEILVANVFKNGPADKAGLKINDIVTHIDGEDFSEKTSDDMADFVKKSPQKQLTLKIKRNTEELEIIINREKVEVPSAASSIIESEVGNLGYINISIFSAVTYEQFKDQLEKLESQNIKGLIIDVRSDTGGYLTTVTDISELFLKKGQVIYQLEDSEINKEIKDNTKEHRQYPIAVLINESSASASEILASAIKESYGGMVVGTNSYGKGTAQKTQILPDGSMIKYTVQKWLTPNGNWINEVGVEPTITVELVSDSIEDNQLETAKLEIIKKISQMKD